MDRKNKINSQAAQFSLTLADFEGIMNKETLCALPSLVNSMDENLSIHINDFINNSILTELKLNQARLVEIIKSSNKFHYDNKSGLIKLKEKADRNILIIANFAKSEDRIEKEEFIKQIIEKCNCIYVNKIKKVDFVVDNFHFVFQNEDISMDVERYITAMLQESSNENELKSSKYFDELSGANVCLAAESLKRRVLANLVNNPLWKQIQLVEKIIGTYVNRRNTAVNNRHAFNIKRDSDMKAAENSKNFHKNSALTTIDNFKHYSSSKINKNRESTTTEFNLDTNNVNVNKLFENFSNKHHRNSKVLHNKFDLVQESFVNYNNINTSGNTRKVSYKENIVADIKIPLNKEYEVDLDKRIERESDRGDAIKLSYTNKEIISVYFHMNFLKKFELPKDFQENFMSGVMLENVKSTLESFRVKKLSIIESRDRSRTLYNISNKRHSSVSRLSSKENVRFNSIHHDIANFFVDVQRKREFSMKAR